MSLEEFINELKAMVTTKYSPYHKRYVHYMGTTILTNQEMKGMLEIMLGDDYTKLTNAQQKRMRRKIFKELE